MKRIFADLFAAVLGTSTHGAPDNAGIFFYGTAPSPEQLAAATPGATTNVTSSGVKVSVLIKWPDVTLQINIDPAWDRGTQLSGIRGWLQSMPSHATQKPEVAAFLSKLENTTTCYGSIITPAYDKDGKVAAALLRILSIGGGGFLFTHQSFYDQSGAKVAGKSDDPLKL